MTTACTLASPLGTLLLVSSAGKLTQLSWGANTSHLQTAQHSRDPVLRQAAEELNAYFAGDKTSFKISIEPVGTVFQRAVWKALCALPYGQTISYGELASQVGNPQAARAVGGAVGANPIPIIIPCHRVLRAENRLGGFSGGLTIKRQLLKLENIRWRENA